MFRNINFILLIAAVSAIKSYDNYKSYRLIPETDLQIFALKNLILSERYSFSSEISTINHPVDIIVGPHQLNTFKNFINKYGIKIEILNENIQKTNYEQNTLSEKFDFTDYHGLDIIYAHLAELAENYPEVTLVKGGKTFEGRDIMGVHVSYSPNNKKNTVFVEAGIHAAEWIAPATALFILNELLTSTEEDVRDVAESYDWYIFPSFNPDGYEYTHTNDRLWRKTRTPYGDDQGVDANRNWDFHWMDAGADNFSSSNYYAGPKPFSEVETSSMSEFIASVAEDLVGYIAFHSYSQLFLTPYSHTPDLLDNNIQLIKIGKKAAQSLRKRYGTEFEVGTFHTALYPASGTSVDWVKGSFGTPITYTIELRDTGKHGFILPPEQIIPTGEETTDALITIFQEAKAYLKSLN